MKKYQVFNNQNELLHEFQGDESSIEKEVNEYLEGFFEIVDSISNGFMIEKTEALGKTIGLNMMPTYQVLTTSGRILIVKQKID